MNDIEKFQKENNRLRSRLSKAELFLEKARNHYINNGDETAGLEIDAFLMDIEE